MNIQTYKIDIDLSLFESQLRGDIGSDLSALKIIEDAIAHKDYPNIKYTLTQGFTVSEISTPPVDFFHQREINKCFKSIMGSIQDYLDKLIAILKLNSTQISIPINAPEEELHTLIQIEFGKLVLNVSTDRALNVPKKLELIFGSSPNVFKDSLQSYFDVRNGLEHHKGISKTDKIVKYKRLGLASTAGYEVTKPGPLGENEGLVLKTFDEEIVYDKGGVLLITKSHLDSIVLNLLMFIIPTIQNLVSEKMNAGKTNS